VVDDQDWLNGQTVGALRLAAASQASAAAKVKDDAVISFILNNPTMNFDATTVFHANHHNLASGGSSALSATSLDTAIGNIGRQVLLAEQDGFPQHYNLRPRYLLVPPELVGLAMRTVRNMDTDGPTLKVRMESRLSDLGVVNPANGTVYKGSATNWMLCAKSSNRPSIVVAGLNGPPTPQMRRFILKNGQFGFGFDVLVDIAVAAVDYRGVYFSVGA
jgi:hypothetical protein